MARARGAESLPPSLKGTTLLPFMIAESVAFSNACIKDAGIECGPESEPTTIDEQPALIESFRQPFPLRERESFCADGE